MLNKIVIPIALTAGLLCISPLAGADQQQEIQVGIQGKTSGDIIAVKFDWQIAKWCNCYRLRNY